MATVLCLTYSIGVDLTLNGVYIPNHGYVVIGDIGSTDDTALICNTNRIANFTVYFGWNGVRFHSRGDWHAPNGTVVGDLGSDDVPGFHRNRGPMVVRLHRRTASDPPSGPSEGMYYCVVEDDTFTEQTVYVGLYNSGGGMGICIYLSDTEYSFLNLGDVIISGGISFTMDLGLHGTSLQFTLTCISTGGPATTVTWTRDSITVTEGTETALDDHTTSQYTHTLTVTGRLGGLYTCSVANNRPSEASAQLTVQGIYVMSRI